MPSKTVPKGSPDKPATAAAVCPFCALLCDDLTLRQQADATFTVASNGCQRANAGFARAPLEPQALVAGRTASLDDAIEAATRLLRRARQPLFGGLATDVDGIRAGVNLAERCGAVLDHVHGDALASMSRMLQARGWYATTLSEVRNRADLVVVIDVDFSHRYESFRRRCLDPKPAPGQGRRTSKGKGREVVFIGAGKRAPAAIGADTTLTCRSENLVEVLLALLATLRGYPLANRRPAGTSASALATLAGKLREARYATFVFAPGALAEHREPAIAAVGDLVDELNLTTRAAMLALGGDDGGQSAVNTCAWLTGFPLRVGCGQTLHYEPQAFATRALLDAGAVDALLWIDAFGEHGSPPPGAPLERTVMLAATRTSAAAQCGVFIPVGTPGVDHFARLLRTDSVVTLALPQQRDSGLPSVAGVLTRILEKF
ncbi:MAG: formylmethanofuran dehydrogenase [Gammaproteobacteria bacterium]